MDADRTLTLTSLFLQAAMIVMLIGYRFSPQFLGRRFQWGFVACLTVLSLVIVISAYFRLNCALSGGALTVAALLLSIHPPRNLGVDPYTILYPPDSVTS